MGVKSVALAASVLTMLSGGAVAKRKLNYKTILLLVASLAVTACGGGGGGGTENTGGEDDTVTTDGGGDATDTGDSDSDATDTLPPVITLNGKAVVNINKGDSYSDAGATADDDVDSDISGEVVTAGEIVDTSKLGSYTITYNVRDAAGNEATQVTRTVNVVEVISKEITQFVAYIVNDIPNTRRTIYTVRGNGKDHRELHPNTPAGGEIKDFSWAPSGGGRLAYLGDVDTDTITELYSVEPDQNIPVKLNDTLVSFGSVIEFKWSPDGTKVAYRADQEVRGKTELYVVDDDGKNRVKVSTELFSSDDVEEFSWSPASSHLLYKTGRARNWYVVTSNGASSQKVNVNLPGTIIKELNQVKWSPLGNYIGYMINQDSTTPDELFVYKISDSSYTKMETALGFNLNTGYQWTNNGSHIAAAIRNGGGMFVAKADGTDAVVFAPPSISARITGFSFLPDKTEVAVFEQVTGLYIYSSDGNLIDDNLINDRNALGATFNRAKVTFSPDGQKVLVIGNGRNSNAVFDLKLDTAVEFSGAPCYVGAASPWSQDSTRLLLSSGGCTLKTLEGNVDVLLADSVPSRREFEDTFDGQWGGDEIYLAIESLENGMDRIIKLNLNGTNPITLANSGGVHEFNSFRSSNSSFSILAGPAFKVADDQGFLVYLRDSISSDSVDGLYSVSTDGTNDVKISIDLPSFSGLDIIDFSIQPSN